MFQTALAVRRFLAKRRGRPRRASYRENGISLWDVAAGGLILERAGGEFWRKPLQKQYTYELIATNGRLRKKIRRLL